VRVLFVAFFYVEGLMGYLCCTIAFVMSVFLGVSCATAQETCLLYQRGTVDCPAYGAPAATAVPGPSMDGGVATVPNASSTTLFSGKVPPNGFMIRVFVPTGSYSPTETTCFVNDNGPAGMGGGFYVTGDGSANLAQNASGTFVTPHGYKPMGPVSIWCQTAGNVVYLGARGW
jgi:hypothetical protein